MTIDETYKVIHALTQSLTYLGWKEYDLIRIDNIVTDYNDDLIEALEIMTKEREEKINGF